METTPRSIKTGHGIRGFRIAPIMGLLFLSGVAYGVTPSAAEKAAVQEWIEQKLTNAAAPPFSFAYGGVASTEQFKGWTVKRAEAGGQTTLSWTDPSTGLVVRCVFMLASDWPAVDWVLHFENTGKQDTPILADIQALDWLVDGTQDGCTLHHARGDGLLAEQKSARSFEPLDELLSPGKGNSFTMAPVGGRSSDGHLPFFNLETKGQGVAAAIGWSGQWQADFRYEGARQLRVRAGMQKTHLLLHPGESIRTPRILLVFWRGDEALRGNNLLRQVLLDRYVPKRNGEPVAAPICASVNHTDPDGSYEGPHVSVIPPLAERGVEVFWSDMDPQQWYPGGFPNGTGTWEPDLKKYPRGLGPVGRAAHANKIEYLLWFEPERVAPKTTIDREHPEWVMRPPGGGSSLYRLHDAKARAWLTDYIDKQITEGGVDWVRWDFNIEPLGFWQRNDEPDRQGMTEIRHVEGLYAMWDELRARHPGLMIDNCASGGRRIDLETCSRSIPLWHSDLQCSGPKPEADQCQNAGLWRWIPFHGCGVFGYEPSYAFRSGMTTGNILCVTDKAGVVSTHQPETREAMLRTVAAYRKLRPFVSGDFYALLPHTESDTAWFGYQFHRDDLNAGVVILFRREKCAESHVEVRLRGIDPATEYQMTLDDGGKPVERVSKLSSLRVDVATAPGSCIVYYKRK